GARVLAQGQSSAAGGARYRAAVARLPRRRDHVSRLRPRQRRPHVGDEGEGRRTAPEHLGRPLRQPRRAGALPPGADDLRRRGWTTEHGGRGARGRREHGPRLRTLSAQGRAGARVRRGHRHRRSRAGGDGGRRLLSLPVRGEHLPRPALPRAGPDHDRPRAGHDGGPPDGGGAGLGTAPATWRGLRGEFMRVRFGINYMPTGSPPEVVRWARLVEELGYEILGISDS